MKKTIAIFALSALLCSQAIEASVLESQVQSQSRSFSSSHHMESSIRRDGADTIKKTTETTIENGVKTVVVTEERSNGTNTSTTKTTTTEKLDQNSEDSHKGDKKCSKKWRKNQKNRNHAYNNQDPHSSRPAMIPLEFVFQNAEDISENNSVTPVSVSTQSVRAEDVSDSAAEENKQALAKKDLARKREAFQNSIAFKLIQALHNAQKRRNERDAAQDIPQQDVENEIITRQDISKKVANISEQINREVKKTLASMNNTMFDVGQIWTL